MKIESSDIKPLPYHFVDEKSFVLFGEAGDIVCQLKRQRVLVHDFEGKGEVWDYALTNPHVIWEMRQPGIGNMVNALKSWAYLKMLDIIDPHDSVREPQYNTQPDQSRPQSFAEPLIPMNLVGLSYQVQ